MNAALKTKWIAALRSGDYKQTTGRLRRVGVVSERFCCLGVLCEVAGVPRNDLGGYDFDNAGRDMTNVRGELADALHGHLDTLVEMNDGNEDTGLDGVGFNRIAAYIEANIPTEAA